MLFRSGVLDKLNGMFAFAIHDAKANSLFLARDRFGVKPLHYVALADGSIAFASELKGLLANPAVRREPDLTAIEDYFALGYVPDDACIVSGVKKLAGGHYLHLKLGKPLPAPVQWWDIDFTRRAKGSLADLEAEMRDRLRAAVTSRMVADVPLGAFLSGGVDSSTVVAFMAEASKSAVQTCSIGFDQAALDETAYADQIAARFATDHRKRLVGSEDYQAIDTLVAAFDEPFADASALPTWRVCQLARETVTVALSGDGADEAFAGYRRHKFQHAEDRVRGMVPQALRGPVLGGLGTAYPKADWAPRSLRAKTTLLSLAGSSEAGYSRAVAILPPELRAGLYSPEFLKLRGDYRAEQPFEAVMRGAQARSGLDRAQYADLKFWLPGDILTKVDRTSMAVSLEAREPLLDHRLIEFAAALPEGLRTKRGEGKWLLKKTMQRYLPDEVLYRPKQGFVMPIAQWFRGPLAESARAIGSSAALARTGWFDAKRLGVIADDHIAGRSDHGRLLWQLLRLDKSLSALIA